MASFGRPSGHWWRQVTFTLVLNWLLPIVSSLKYDPTYVGYNLNTNQNGTSPLEYDGTWDNHVYTPSPDNWRLPFYTIMIDRFVNGDPLNDNVNGTIFEQDTTSTKLRYGGDIAGLVDSLDYIQGMGIRCIYITGSPFINQPWQYDSYSPLDNTLLDLHFGTILEWRAAVDEIHKRGMYIILDNTMATLSDLIGYEDYKNTSAPFEPKELKTFWKSERKYHDWTFTDQYNETCSNFPRLYLENGDEAGPDVYSKFQGCYDSDFDQYGDTEAFGFYPDYRRQLTKFNSVQDRLREWVPSVNEKLAHFSCILIKMLDIDGFRYDKALQITVDAQGLFAKRMRECARSVGKHNFFQPGEVTGGNTLGAIYIGRGRQPNQRLQNIDTAGNLTNATDLDAFLRDPDHQALDAVAFHYSFYRHLAFFLGLDGAARSPYDLPDNLVDAWNEVLLTNDLVNANTGKTDPRHMYGAGNQDTFRWPGLTLGNERSLMGLFISTLHIPGIPLLLWGEEQAYYTLDSTAENYMYGRQPLSSAPAWQTHACYKLEGDKYYQMPYDSVRRGCLDEKLPWDHRDPVHPMRNILKHMYKLRERYPVLQDGLWLQQLSNHTQDIFYPGNSGVATTTGLFSVLRHQLGSQNLGQNVVPVWLLYSNRNTTWTYTLNCSDKETALVAPFKSGSRVKNLFYPHDEMTLEDSPNSLTYTGETGINGCVGNVTMKPFEYRAYVPVKDFEGPPPMLTKFFPGHDYRLEANKTDNVVPIEFQASTAMNCNSFKDAIKFKSTTGDGSTPQIAVETVECKETFDPVADWTGTITSAWSWKANLTNVKPGVHEIIVTNPSTLDGSATTKATDRFILRVGPSDNPLVFPQLSNYASNALSRTSNGDLKLSHKASGATKFRYSTNWESSWSDWKDYESETTIQKQEWSGTTEQAWRGEHVVVQYFSKILGTSSYKMHADLDFDQPRRFPHLYAVGPFNEFGYDGGVTNALTQKGDSQWEWHFMDEWPSIMQLSVWGLNPDKKPDKSFLFGDVRNDFTLERVGPASLGIEAINITKAPEKPAIAYRLVVNDATMRYELLPQGNMWTQLVIYIALWVLPIVGGLAAVHAFKSSFYKVKLNKQGLHDRYKLRAMVRKLRTRLFGETGMHKLKDESGPDMVMTAPAALGEKAPKRRRVLIATLEYNIDDWDIKVKIGGLGVMAQLMGKALDHLDLIWVVPCVGDITYPVDTPAEDMSVTIMDRVYQVKVQYHQTANTTFVLLDAPVFSKQTKAVPYPARMDDLESAIFYSAWNQCIAETMNRFSVGIYHCNDYHGALAPLYLLPRTIPCALSLHNAEFQGMWPMRTSDESKEVCKVFNLDEDVVKKFCQYGSVFNLLNAGASYLRVYQRGFGAVGVSEKYGDRAFARYPIFWGLPQIGKLPNPDPTDTAAWDKIKFLNDKTIEIDQEYEGSRSEDKRQAQEWAGLEPRPDAELFVFVGRWCMQKGVDLIADVFPSILERHPAAQLICVGPVIDLYGRFAALKLSKLMDMYPGRVYSRPEFTALPPYIFSGAEFALIPSRDEPFGLVAVEFGRKGALGVGARVGGLGQMPGWWYTVESTKAHYLIKQFKRAIETALSSDQSSRAKMRAWSAKQRFPVAEWVEKLGELHDGVIKSHKKSRDRKSKMPALSMSNKSRGTLNIRRADSPFVESSAAWVPTIPDHDSRSATPIHTPGESWRVNSPQTGDPLLSQFPGFTPFESPRNLSEPDPFDDPLVVTPTIRLGIHENANSSVTSLSMDEVVGDRQDYKLQQTDSYFTDSDGAFYRSLDKRLDGLTPKNSLTDLCLEKFLVKSEEEWFDMYRRAKLGRANLGRSSFSREGLGSANSSRSRLGFGLRQADGTSLRHSVSSVSLSNVEGEDGSPPTSGFSPSERSSAVSHHRFVLPLNHVPPSGVERCLQSHLGDWPIYAILLIVNQVIAANPLQVTLLAGQLSHTSVKLSIVESIYLVSTVIWYAMSRVLPLRYCLCIPYFFYGTCFVILAWSPFSSSTTTLGWVQNVAIGFYAFASSSGPLAFSFNFGTEGGSTVTKWIQRMVIVQGLSQFYTMGLWAFGSSMAFNRASNLPVSPMSTSPWLLAICLPLTVLLWGIGLVLYKGLPKFYRDSPGAVSQLWKTLLRLKTIAWYLFAVVVQNYFMGTLYGRNWAFLFSSKVLPIWSVVLLALGSLVIWAFLLFGLALFSEGHPWLFPMFAVGLGAPRWAQIWWGTSRIGLWMPWAGGPIMSALLSRVLWLWLGVLDSVQGGAVGVILMLTLTRIHVAAACIAAQILGSAVNILARHTAPNKMGPGTVFPSPSQGIEFVASCYWFWVVLGLQLLLCVGYFKFFRKDQVSKP